MSSKMTEQHQITLQSGRSASGDASAWARTLAQKAGLSEDRVYALDLCIVEIVSNVVDHSYRGAAGEIRVDLGIAGDAAIVTISDEGPVFDPLSVAPPATPASLDDARVGGYGIHMVRSTADDCRYERREGRNVFTAYFGVSPGRP